MDIDFVRSLISKEETYRFREIMSQAAISEPDKWEAFVIYYKLYNRYLGSDEFKKDFNLWLDEIISNMASISDIKIGDKSSFKFE